jgi:hypothetical protein
VRRLASLPARVFAGAYFALIPIFALVYAGAFPHAFHDSVAHLEPSVRAAPEQFRSDLEHRLDGDVAARLIRQSEPPFVAYRVQTLQVLNVLFEGRTLTFTMLVGLARADGRRGLVLAPLRGKVQVDAALDIQLVGGTLRRYWPVAVEATHDYAPKSLPSWLVASRLFSTDGGQLVEVSPALQNQARAIASALSGSPDELPGHILRMLYLSSVTITTLGFGDIVPITNGARLAVAAEAILGVLLIGFFLNALAMNVLPPARAEDLSGQAHSGQSADHGQSRGAALG